MASTDAASIPAMGMAEVSLPKVTIKFCTQCKWNLRAAYYAQELLQTFSTTLGEIALVPVTGGIFTVTILHVTPSTSTSTSTNIPAESITSTLLWDRKTEGGFPETKELKNRVRNVVDPKRDMGHIDRSLMKGKGGQGRSEPSTKKGDEVSASGSLAMETKVAQIEGQSREVKAETDFPVNVPGKEDCEDCR